MFYNVQNLVKKEVICSEQSSNKFMGSGDNSPAVYSNEGSIGSRLLSYIAQDGSESPEQSEKTGLNTSYRGDMDDYQQQMELHRSMRTAKSTNSFSRMYRTDSRLGQQSHMQ